MFFCFIVADWVLSLLPRTFEWQFVVVYVCVCICVCWYAICMQIQAARAPLDSYGGYVSVCVCACADWPIAWVNVRALRVVTRACASHAQSCVCMYYSYDIFHSVDAVYEWTENFHTHCVRVCLFVCVHGVHAFARNCHSERAVGHFAYAKGKHTRTFFGWVIHVNVRLSRVND